MQANLSASLVDIGNQLLWSKSKDGERGRNRPKPIPRPGVKGRDAATQYKGDAFTADQLRERLARPRTAALK